MLIPSKMLQTLKALDEILLNNTTRTPTKTELQQVFSDDIELHMPYGMPKLVGIDNVLKRYQLEAKLFQHFKVERNEPIIAGNHAATFINATILDIRNDEFAGFEAIEIAEFNADYKVSKNTVYIDLDTLNHALDKETLKHLFSI